MKALKHSSAIILIYGNINMIRGEPSTHHKSMNSSTTSGALSL